MLFLQDVSLAGARVLLRVDYNVPLKDGHIVDDNRIVQSLPTVRHILDAGASLIICSHLGRPKGAVDPAFSLAPVAERLSALVNRPVELVPEVVGPQTSSRAAQLRPGEILMLENLRFHPGETKNDPEFSRQLASLATVYVNDAFGASHRAHASVVGVTEFVDVCCGGLLLEKEWRYLGEALKDPKRPFVAVIGGAKVSTKLGILHNLLSRVDALIVVGAMANTFRKAQGFAVGTSLVEDDLVEEAAQIMLAAKERGVRFYLPVDYIVGTDPKATTPLGVCTYQDVPDNAMVLDSGPASHTLFSEVVRDAGTVVWNGPLGAFENPVFAQGTENFCRVVAALPGLTIVGGGDTNVVIQRLGLTEKFSFISTGGGAFLEFLEGKTLPAFAALEAKARR
ncbi:phosphoglycerate kinase [Thermodesulfomicrobium sp. WS]|uniref:phosphoglycerate kinase n=1 Tax=Thermodesulfomicrobium sp. WS TaxID=3004129 RepID=UPI0024925634|nr:phosphoglycerate kinase [Thermodesulfomicrobium sp. WS]BDV01330.1 phosphoglycerate kinase [Thermodesulfomicrobium sp. WS]